MYNEILPVNENYSFCELSVIQDLGERDEQQDCFWYSGAEDCLAAAVCDGMGGYSGGRQASQAAINALAATYGNGEFRDASVQEFLIRMTHAANEAVMRVASSDPMLAKAGTTMVTVLLKNRKLYWCSVGDSRAYLFRNGQFVQLTVDQTYQTVLNEQLNAGVISSEKYGQESRKGAALINYLGVDPQRLIDYSEESVELREDDRVLITTDGLYKLLEDREMAGILSEFPNIHEALKMLKRHADRSAARRNSNRDNITAVLLRIHG